MPRPSIWTHRKLHRLTRLIRPVCPAAPMALAVGLLESIWRTAYESGDPVLGSAEDVEDAAGWLGETGVLCAALAASGWIDPVGDHTYAVHDLLDHAPEYVRRRRRREQDRRRRSADQSLTGQRPATDQSVTGQ